MTIDDLDGKSVALIGPARHVAELDQRELIQGFDYVARMNHALPVPETVARNTTSRCDILYFHRDVPEKPEWVDVPLLRMNTQENFGEDIMRFSETIRDRIIRVPPMHAQNQMEETRKTPNMGPLAVADLLGCGVRRLYITGFTFYRTNIYYQGYDHELPDGLKEPDIRPDYIKGGHNPSKDLDYFIRHFAHRVEMDGVLKQIIEEHQ
jgi:hypothetical protein